MNIARSHLDALKALAYTEAEARFLYIVATHSGYFVARQFLAFQGVHWGKRTTVFWSKLDRQKHARAERFPKSGTIYHLFSRRLYRHIEKENLRNRRVHELDFIKRRIAILDSTRVRSRSTMRTAHHAMDHMIISSNNRPM